MDCQRRYLVTGISGSATASSTHGGAGSSSRSSHHRRSHGTSGSKDPKPSKSGQSSKPGKLHKSSHTPHRASGSHQASSRRVLAEASPSAMERGKARWESRGKTAEVRQRDVGIEAGGGAAGGLATIAAGAAGAAGHGPLAAGATIGAGVGAMVATVPSAAKAARNRGSGGREQRDALMQSAAGAAGGVATIAAGAAGAAGHGPLAAGATISAGVGGLVAAYPSIEAAVRGGEPRSDVLQQAIGGTGAALGTIAAGAASLGGNDTVSGAFTAFAGASSLLATGPSVRQVFRGTETDGLADGVENMSLDDLARTQSPASDGTGSGRSSSYASGPYDAGSERSSSPGSHHAGTERSSSSGPSYPVATYPDSSGTASYNTISYGPVDPAYQSDNPYNYGPFNGDSTGTVAPHNLSDGGVATYDSGSDNSFQTAYSYPSDNSFQTAYSYLSQRSPGSGES